MSGLVLATRNDHKVTELRHILADVVDGLGLQVLSATEFPGVPDVVESEVTFEGNARLKAMALVAATGLPVLADDSGLTVDVLGGSPGVFSARWSGSLGGAALSRPERDALNLRLLLDQLADVPDAYRAASFMCAAVVALPDGRSAATYGRLLGRLTRRPRGANGFGYDPILVPDGDTRTLAEHTQAEKNAISHRGRAFRALAPHLRRLLGP
ncbi:MAG: RdgB/HAM1 family non-canonical purine NTP pyrophosphatase [Dermatophilaceae bacterium]